MKQINRIPYVEIKRIILNCIDKRTQAAIAFDYGFGCRVGELAKDYTHHRKKVGEKKEKDYVSQGPIIADFKTRINVNGEKELVFKKPNFKQKMEVNRQKQRVDISRFETFINEKWEPWLFEIILKWIINKPLDANIFDIRERSLRYYIDKELKKYNSDYASHWLRHARGSDIAEITQDPYAVQAILGHGDIRTSMRYVNKLAASLYKSMQGRNGFEDVLGRSIVKEEIKNGHE